MEGKSILIQCDEMTKNMMGELQDDMMDSLSKISKSMTSEVVDKIKNVEKKLNDFKKEVGDFLDDNEDFQEMIEEVNSNISDITKSIESTIESSIIRVMGEHSKMIIEHNKLFNENLHKLMEDSQILKESFKNLNDSVNVELQKLNAQIGELNIEDLEDKLAILGLKIVKDAEKNKNEILDKIENVNNDRVEEEMVKLNHGMESNFFTNKQLMCEKFRDISDKIDEKELLIKIIHGYENDMNEKIQKIQEEVEWGNRSFLSRIFGKKRK